MSFTLGNPATLRIIDSEAGIVPVRGLPVIYHDLSLAGYRFYVHYAYQGNGWNLTEAITGRYVASECTTMRAAVTTAELRIKTHFEAFRKALETTPRLP